MRGLVRKGMPRVSFWKAGTLPEPWPCLPAPQPTNRSLQGALIHAGARPRAPRGCCHSYRRELSRGRDQRGRVISSATVRRASRLPVLRPSARTATAPPARLRARSPPPPVRFCAGAGPARTRGGFVRRMRGVRPAAPLLLRRRRCRLPTGKCGKGEPRVAAAATMGVSETGEVMGSPQLPIIHHVLIVS